MATTRRQFATFLGAAGFSGLAAGAAPAEKEEEISPAEDLMREHGALNRVLLIYEEAIRRIELKADLDPKVLSSAARIIHRFVEDYHEKLEEDHLFPRFEKAGKLVELVRVLRDQHQAGRRITAEIERLATAASLKDLSSRSRLAESLGRFIHMYRPHEAREDTVLFPAFRGLVSAKEYDALGDEFEKREDQLFGEEGFFKVVDEIAGIEKQLGIYDLAKFTPRQA